MLQILLKLCSNNFSSNVILFRCMIFGPFYFHLVPIECFVICAGVYQLGLFRFLFHVYFIVICVIFIPTFNSVLSCVLMAARRSDCHCKKCKKLHLSP